MPRKKTEEPEPKAIEVDEVEPAPLPEAPSKGSQAVLEHRAKLKRMDEIRGF